MQIECNRSILAIFSQANLYGIQTTKHTPNVYQETINVSIFLKHNICNYMCGYMMHFPFDHPKIISSSITSNVASFIACGACN